MNEDRMTWPMKDGCLDLVFSPDEAGWYFHEYKFGTKRDRISKRLYATKDDAIQSKRVGTIKWEKWR